MEELGFVKYFDELASKGKIKADIQPPINASEIFMGCGHINNTKLDVGIVANPTDMFYRSDNGHGQVFDAKPVKEFYANYDT